MQNILATIRLEELGYINPNVTYSEITPNGEKMNIYFKVSGISCESKITLPI